MSTKTGAPLESTPISDWLEELHMECYKKNLEDFETIKTLLDVKEIELKKLGVYNSRDRAAMLGSLANYRAVREESSLCE
jgi:cobalamin biosynthesis protein CbiG